MSRYTEIMRGLQEALEYQQGHLEGVQTHRMSIAEVKTFTPEEIKIIRVSADMTQSMFAACIGVSKKAVEAWEGGRSRPDGAARRTIGLIQDNPHYAEDVGILMR